MICTLSTAIAALLSFLAGLFSFKVKSRWCPRCGANTLPDRASNRAKPS
jgi:NADH pyrophosphatase NudC (nudix superfamily)